MVAKYVDIQNHINQTSTINHSRGLGKRCSGIGTQVKSPWKVLDIPCVLLMKNTNVGVSRINNKQNVKVLTDFLLTVITSFQHIYLLCALHFIRKLKEKMNK